MSNEDNNVYAPYITEAPDPADKNLPDWTPEYLAKMEAEAKALGIDWDVDPAAQGSGISIDLKIREPRFMVSILAPMAESHHFARRSRRARYMPNDQGAESNALAAKVQKLAKRPQDLAAVMAAMLKVAAAAKKEAGSA